MRQSTAGMTGLPPGVARSKIPFFVKDIVKISNPAIIRKVVSSEDIGRPAQTELPPFIRLFFSASKFYHLPTKSFAAPQEGDDDNERPTRRQVIDDQLKLGFTNAQIDRLTALVKGNQDYEGIGIECAKIIAELILPLPEGEELPDGIARACFRTLIETKEMFNPIRFFQGRSSRKQVEEYLAKVIPGEPHHEDYLHNLGAGAHGLGRAVLSMREMATDDVSVHFANNPIIPGIMRVPLQDTTLDGTFPEDEPLRENGTIIILNVGEAATETQDELFLFGSGIEFRQCPFKTMFFSAAKEIKKKMVAPS